jgi:hypothetical protein
MKVTCWQWITPKHNTFKQFKMIGALVVTDKPVVVNSGSFGGSSTMLNNGQPTGRDVGLTKSSQQKKLGKNIFFVKGLGTDEIERVLLIANEDNTKYFLDGVTLLNTK